MADRVADPLTDISNSSVERQLKKLLQRLSVPDAATAFRAIQIVLTLAPLRWPSLVFLLVYHKQFPFGRLLVLRLVLLPRYS